MQKLKLLSPNNDSVLEFQAHSDLRAEIKIGLANCIFVNNGKGRFDMKN